MISFTLTVGLAVLLPQDRGPALPEDAVLRLAPHGDAVRAVAFSPDGGHLLSGSRDTTLVLWEAKTGRRVREFRGHAEGVASVAFSPDGRTALSGSQDHTLALWDVGTGERLRTFNGHSGWVRPVAFSPDGRLALSASLDRTGALWDVQTGKRLHSLEGNVNFLFSAAFAPVGRAAALGAGDGKVTIWDVEKGERQHILSGHSDGVFALAFSPDGRYLVSGGWYRDPTLQLWEAATGQHVTAVRAHEAGISCVAFTPDGKYVVSASADQTIAIWDIMSGQLVRRLGGQGGHVHGVALSPGGRTLASGAEDGTVLLWQPGLAETQKAIEWGRGWRAKEEGARRRELEEILAELSKPDWLKYVQARERLIEAREEAVRAIVDRYPPEAAAKPPVEERLSQLLAELDSDDFQIRQKARKELKAGGSAILPWVEKQLKEAAGLSAEVRSGLADVAKELQSPDHGMPALGPLRAILTLIEFPHGDAAGEALKRYAEGSKGSYLTDLVRRSLGR